MKHYRRTASLAAGMLALAMGFAASLAAAQGSPPPGAIDVQQIAQQAAQQASESAQAAVERAQAAQEEAMRQAEAAIAGIGRHGVDGVRHERDGRFARSRQERPVHRRGRQ